MRECLISIGTSTSENCSGKVTLVALTEAWVHTLSFLRMLVDVHVEQSEEIKSKLMLCLKNVYAEKLSTVIHYCYTVFVYLEIRGGTRYAGGTIPFHPSETLSAQQ